MINLYCIRLSISNAFLLKGPKNILIDTGSPGEGKKIIKAINHHGLQLSDISLILHTHGHSDHCGSTHELIHHCKIPTALHKGDLDRVKSGSNGKVTTTTLFSRFLLPFVDKPFKPFLPDYFLESLSDLSDLGINGSVLHTPGHTRGSISIELDNQEMIIGDLLMGGMMGGTFFPGLPGYHYFIEDREALHMSIELILTRPAKRFWVGHGGPLNVKEVIQWYKSIQRRQNR